MFWSNLNTLESVLLTTRKVKAQKLLKPLQTLHLLYFFPSVAIILQKFSMALYFILLSRWEVHFSRDGLNVSLFSNWKGRQVNYNSSLSFDQSVSCFWLTSLSNADGIWKCSPPHQSNCSLTNKKKNRWGCLKWA